MKKIVLLITIVFSVLLITSCGEKSDSELWDEAEQLKAEEKYVESLTAYKNLIDEFPDSEHYVDALFEVGKMYHGKVDKNLPGVESLKKAAEFYKMVHEAEPNTDRGASALFMLGFIQANEISQFDEAKITYEKFIEMYPDHDLVQSAKAELETLGIPPEEILTRKSTEE